MGYVIMFKGFAMKRALVILIVTLGVSAITSAQDTAQEVVPGDGGARITVTVTGNDADVVAKQVAKALQQERTDRLDALEPAADGDAPDDADITFDLEDAVDAEEPDAEPVTEDIVKTWACTMHPEIHLPEPGQCPVCNMDLIFMATDPTPPATEADADAQAPAEPVGEEVPEADTLVELEAAIADAQAAIEAADDAAPANTVEGDVPADVLLRLAKLTNPGLMEPAPVSEADFLSRFIPQQTQALAIGADALLNFPEATNLGVVRLHMLQAANALYGSDPRTETRAQIVSVCDEIIANEMHNANILADADMTKTFLTISDDPSQAKTLIAALVARHIDSDATGNVTFIAALLASKFGLDDLVTQYADTLEVNHMDEPGVAMFLFALGRDVPFTTELPTFNGDTLTLPDDLKGSVVLIDIWTSWCTYCSQIQPHLQRLDATYRDRGLVIVGVNMDDTQAEAESYLATSPGDTWQQTYTGPLPNRFGEMFDVRGFPTLFLIGRDGNLISASPADMSMYPNWEKVITPMEDLIVETLGPTDGDTPADDAAPPEVEDVIIIVKEPAVPDDSAEIDLEPPEENSDDATEPVDNSTD